ncbi:g10745 [Coccomyxa viridis]|uniref:Bis(5'-adenosyl)-triphosphatase n=1 Tax=Coccomyxa viridis TaxID=1274662 RepID=A0ABP1G8V5_9CHLO
MCSPSQSVEDHQFGPHKIRASEIFASTELSFAFVNLKPVVPGHVLVCSRRVVQRFTRLQPAEVADMWCLAQKAGQVVEPHFGATSLTLAIQDGIHAGQSVPHVHVHVLPRRPGDFKNNDDVYDAIDDASKAAVSGEGEKLDLDAERKVRTPEEMAAEAQELRVAFQQLHSTEQT